VDKQTNPPRCLIDFGLDPADAAQRQNYQAVAKIRLRVTGQKGKQKRGHIFRGGRMRLHPNNSEMFGQWQDNPIAKMSIERDERSLFLHGSPQNKRVVSPGLTGLGRAHDIMPGFPHKLRHFD
jgi:hypothetical protein